MEWFKQPKSLWKLFGGFVLSIILFFGLVRIGIFGSLPSFEELKIPPPTWHQKFIRQILFWQGKYYVDNRSNVSFDDLPAYLPKALVAMKMNAFMIIQELTLKEP